MMTYFITLSLLIAAIILIRAVFRRRASARVVYALWLAVAVRLCLPMSFISVDLPAVPFVPESGIAEESVSDPEPLTPELVAPETLAEAVGEQQPIVDSAEPEKDAAFEESDVPNGEVHVDAPEAPAQTAPTVPIAPTVPDDAVVAPVVPNEIVTPDIPEPNDAPTVPESPAVPDSSILSDTPSANVGKVDTPVENVPADIQSPVPTESTIDVAAILKATWISGSAVMFAFFATTWTVFNLRLRNGRKFHSKAGSVNVYVTEHVASPCVAGIVPAIYITPFAADCEETLELVLKHERTHIRHGDHVWSFLRCIALTVHWWNPLVWVAVILSKRDAELACDEAVAAKLDVQERIEYAMVIIGMIPVKKNYAIGFGNEPLKERIEMLTNNHKNAIIAAVLAVVMAMTSVGCSFVKDTDASDIDAPKPPIQTVGESDGETETETDTETDAVPETQTPANNSNGTASGTVVMKPQWDTTGPAESTKPEGSGKTEYADIDTPEKIESGSTQKVITGADDFKYEVVKYQELYKYNYELAMQYEETLTADSPTAVSVIRIDTYEEAREMILIDKGFIGKYDEEYFENKSLMLIYNSHPCESFTDTYSDFTFDGKAFSFDLETHMPQIWTDLVEHTCCYLEIDGRLPEDIEYKVELIYVEDLDPTPKPNVELKYTAEVFEGYGLNFGNGNMAKYEVPLVIEGDETLKAFRLDSIDEYNEFSAACRDEKDHYTSAMMKYNTHDYSTKEFFKKNSLFIIINWNESDSRKDTYSNFAFDGKTFSFDVDTYIPLIQTNVKEVSMCVMAIKDMFSEDTAIKVKHTCTKEKTSSNAPQKVLNAETFATSFNSFMIDGTHDVYYDGLAKYEISGRKSTPNSYVFIIDSYRKAQEMASNGYFSAVLENYNAEYFEKGSLIIINEVSSSGSNVVTFSEPEFDGKILSCNVETKFPEIGTDDLQVVGYLIELDGRLPDNSTINITSSEIIGFDELPQQIVTPKTFDPVTWKTTTPGIYFGNVAEYEFNKNGDVNFHKPNVYVIETYDRAVDIINADKGKYDSSGGLAEILKKYDASFFEKKSLVIIVAYAGCLDCGSEFSTPVFDGKTLSCEVYIDSSGMSEQIEYHVNVIEVNGRLPSDVEMDITITRE